ncbi:MAG: lipopolysaccharide heptosyltransferase II [Candidatus Omnitrophica bacterium]|nr:lipopolysaccharide heptosyltransferase II [Candidatus Omnitrophota bacterium]
MNKRILIINPFGIGDVIFSTPLIEALRKSFPDSFIAYICNKRAAELLRTDPNLNKVFVYERDEHRDVWERSKAEYFKEMFSALAELRKQRFDVLIDLSLAYQYNLFAMIAGIKKRIGFNYKGRGRFLTDRIDIDGFNEKHVVDYYLAVLKFLSIDAAKNKTSVKIYASQPSLEAADTVLNNLDIKKEDFLIGMVPGCGASWGADASRRRWDKNNFALLANRLIEKYNAKIILFGDKKEVDICDNILNVSKNKIINYCGKTSLPELAGLMSRCRLVISNDGGPLHMAVGLGVNTVSIFGPVDEKIYGPYSSVGKHIVVCKKDLTCRPCYKKFRYKKCEDRICLGGISIDDVFNAAEKILKK